MQGGDISNETSPRIMVHADVVAVTEVQDERKLLRSTQERVLKNLNNLALSQLWNLSHNYGLSVELIAYEEDLWTQGLLDKIMDKLERRGGNPFNYAELYDSVAELVGELPYRNNLKGVIDVPGRVARYGSAGIELNNL